jgi:hypothetical protein
LTQGPSIKHHGRTSTSGQVEQHQMEPKLPGLSQDRKGSFSVTPYF